MDTPLYVLSTAASMVESVDVAKCQNIEEASLRHITTEPSSSTKTLTMAACPVSDRYQQCGSSQNMNSGTLQNLSDNRRKCAGTQTSLSSFSSATYGLPEKYIRMESAGSVAWTGRHKSSVTSSPSPPAYYQHHSTVSTTGHHPYGGGLTDDSHMDCDMPLNLTKSSSSHQSNVSGGGAPTSTSTSSATSHSPSSHCSSSPLSSSGRQSPPTTRHALVNRTTESAQSPRLSVIIRNNPHGQQPDGAQLPSNGTRDGRMLGNCDDPEIEEHFRRSLGTKYQSYMTSCSLPRNGEIPDTVASSASNISITGNVDDHFAKSLGETWTQLNAQRQSSLTGTVDDHFAKALGETWYKIKAKVETESRGPAGVVPL